MSFTGVSGYSCILLPGLPTFVYDPLDFLLGLLLLLWGFLSCWFVCLLLLLLFVCGGFGLVWFFLLCV